MEKLVADHPEILKPLFVRYAPSVFHGAQQSVWRKSLTYNPKLGAFRPWLMQIAHYRILDELEGAQQEAADRPGCRERRWSMGIAFAAVQVRPSARFLLGVRTAGAGRLPPGSRSRRIFLDPQNRLTFAGPARDRP